jgi:hypothetical protein
MLTTLSLAFVLSTGVPEQAPLNLRHDALAAPAVVQATVQDPATLLAILQHAQSVLSILSVDPKELANNIHYLAQGNIWPMWTCTYADGTVVYNKFRWYRDAQKVTLYFIGQPDSHDRDAYYYWNGRKVRWDTRFAVEFARQHGGIRDIRPIE